VAAQLRRIGLQLAYAGELAKDHPEFAQCVREAEATVAEYAGDGQGLESLADRVEATLAPLATAAKRNTIHLVGHGHIDMNWMWSWPETVATTHDTFASVLDLMRRYPEFTYSQSQASVYALTEQYHPAMFEEIRQRVREGRWEVSAAHWVEGDKNLAAGESIARHLLYTRAYFQDRFGLSPEDVPVDWEPDTFGHAHTIPTILAQAAVKYYYCCRPGGGHHHDRIGDERPPLFWWQGPDGARVLVNREVTWYNSYVNIGDDYAAPMVRFARRTGLSHWLNVYGVGNHGGGPTRSEIEYYKETQAWPIWPTVQFSTAKAYFEAIEAEILSGVEVPVLDHELNFEFTGCYTSQSAIKRANRFGENYCLEAEGLSLVQKAVAGTEPDTGLLKEAWIPVLFNQFHDILPGSGVAATREHAVALFQEVAAKTGAVKREALKALGSRLNTAALIPQTPEGQQERQDLEAGQVNDPYQAGVGQGAHVSGMSAAKGGGKRFQPVLIYNPLPWDRTEIVIIHLYDLDFPAHRIVATDESGKTSPTLPLYHSPNTWQDWGHIKDTVLLKAENVPAFGYKTYLIHEGVADEQPEAVHVESERDFAAPEIRVRFDRDRCGFEITSDVEGQLGRQGVWSLVNERPRGMTSWMLGAEVAPPSPLVAKGYEIRGAARNEATDLIISSSFAYVIKQEFEVPGTRSKLVTHSVVQTGRPRVDVVAEVDWREIGDQDAGIPGLVVDFHVNVQGDQALYESPMGTVLRTLHQGEEVPTLRFAHLPENGLTLLQDSKYGHARRHDGLRMRVVRSSFDPDHAPEVGKSTLRYSVVLHDAPPSPADLVRLGAEWNHPLLVTATTLQHGDLPSHASFGQDLGSDAVLVSVKPGERGGSVLRFVNTADVEAVGSARLNAALLGAEATQVDLLERPVPGAVEVDGDTLSVPVAPRSIASVWVR
jgi:alpha-mannosidase